MNLASFLNRLHSEPEQIEFDDTMTIIDANYDFTPTAFRNGQVDNEAGQNNGSCKILAFAQINKLTVEQTLACFGKFYREDVLGNPEGDDHQNIRNFMVSGWQQVEFSGTPLTAK